MGGITKMGEELYLFFCPKPPKPGAPVQSLKLPVPGLDQVPPTLAAPVPTLRCWIGPRPRAAPGLWKLRLRFPAGEHSRQEDKLWSLPRAYGVSHRKLVYELRTFDGFQSKASAGTRISTRPAMLSFTGSAEQNKNFLRLATKMENPNARNSLETRQTKTAQF